MSRTHTYLINGDLTQIISPLDRGFAYGDGVFRTMVVRGGLPVDWPLHYQKLVADCAAIGIVCPSAELLMSDFLQLFSIEDIDSNQLEVAKIIITRGEGERGYKPPAVTSPTRVVIKTAISKFPPEYNTTGVHLHLCETRLAMQAKLAGVKHLNRLENVLARMEWRDEDIFDGLMLDQQSNVIECTMSNVFARFDNVFITPDLSQCGVAGVTRQRIMGLASVVNLTVEIAPLSLSRLLHADEIIICNSLYGALQVTKIGDVIWPPQALANTFRNLLSHK
ncbi:MAG: aminodeoxychorismate lyase [Methylotenera sp.]|nr:aminodeoxychorismate lyase [Methylotenera sp.]